MIGNGLVVDPQALFAELDELQREGIVADGRLFISERAHLILPYHRDIEQAAEVRRGDHRIGTTSRGIGPSYEDKSGRRGIRLADLADADSGRRARRRGARQCGAAEQRRAAATRWTGGPCSTT